MAREQEGVAVKDRSIVDLAHDGMTVQWHRWLGTREELINDPINAPELVQVPGGLPPGVLEVECRQAFTEVYWGAPFAVGPGSHEKGPANRRRSRLGPGYSRAYLHLPHGTKCGALTLSYRLLDRLDAGLWSGVEGLMVTNDPGDDGNPALVTRFYPGLIEPPSLRVPVLWTIEAAGNPLADRAQVAQEGLIGWPPGYARSLTAYFGSAVNFKWRLGMGAAGHYAPAGGFKFTEACHPWQAVVIGVTNATIVFSYDGSVAGTV